MPGWCKTGHEHCDLLFLGKHEEIVLQRDLLCGHRHAADAGTAELTSSMVFPVLEGFLAGEWAG